MKTCYGTLLWCLVAPGASAQQLTFTGDTTTVPALARTAMATYHGDDLFHLQIVAGQYADAARTVAALRSGRATNAQYEIYARAMADGPPFDEGYRREFREVVGRMDDRTSALVVRALATYRPTLDNAWHTALREQTGKRTIGMTDALRIIRTYQIAESYRAFAPLIDTLIAEDDRRRYVIDRDVQVKTPGGSIVCAARIVRPRAGPVRRPTLLQFSIYNPNMADARRSASNGYVGIEGEPRGKQCSPDKPVPYEFDGTDAAALIDWIGVQPWSDGRVGMFGGSYNGGAQWAAAKRMPKALKALMPQAPVAPGIDVPMEGNVGWMFVYPWTFYTTDAPGNDRAVYEDRARWTRLQDNWYTSGRAYRDLDKIDGTPNPFFDRWLDHPSYDAYWQHLIPYRDEFARITIPVLQTAGYYYGGPGAAMYYLTQHYTYNPRAEHYLVIGPYDHLIAQSGPITDLGDPIPVINGYALDSAAMIDMGELRYQWFDYVFKGAPKPALLADRINYQVMGTNTWKHAPSVAAMANHHLRIPLRDTTLSVDLADRSDVHRESPGGGIADSAIDTWNAVTVVSDPLTAPTEVSGLFSGSLDFIANKKDFDFQVQLYELTPDGQYVQLAPYWARASYVGDLTHRRLLTSGRRQRLAFTSVRLMSRRCQAGSRIVVVLSVIKETGRQINYGTGKDVSDETIADATAPLRIQWLGDSFIEVPVKR